MFALIDYCRGGNRHRFLLAIIALIVCAMLIEIDAANKGRNKAEYAVQQFVWPYNYPPNGVADHFYPTPILPVSYAMSNFFLFGAQVPVCYYGRNWAFDVSQLPGMAETAYSMVYRLTDNWDYYMPDGYTLYAVHFGDVDFKSENCFMTINFAESMPTSYVMASCDTNRNYIHVNNVGRFNNPLLWHKTVAHEMGHAFMLADDYDGLQSVMNMYREDAFQMLYRRDVHSLNDVFNRLLNTKNYTKKANHLRYRRNASASVKFRTIDDAKNFDFSKLYDHNCEFTIATRCKRALVVNFN